VDLDRQKCRDCCRCGEKAQLAIKVFDPRKGREIRVFKCRCGELIWDDQAAAYASE